MSRPKSRSGSDSAADASLAEKKKARHRLVGAIALCLVAAVVVPMLLESEPRTGLRSLPMTVEAAAGSTRADQPWIRPPTADDAAEGCSSTALRRAAPVPLPLTLLGLCSCLGQLSKASCPAVASF